MNTNNQVCLYIATHNKTGLKYFGKTIRYFTQEDLQSKYHGSGVYWNNHLKVHGDDVTMEIYGIFNINEVEEIALKFSSDNNIVKALNESDKKIWANEKPENGLDGSPKGQQQVIELKSGKRLSINVNDFDISKHKHFSADMVSVVIDGKGKLIPKETFKKGQYLTATSNKVTVKLHDGSFTSVDKNSNEWISGEYSGSMKNTVTVKDSKGNKLRVSCNDSRYLSGELVGTTKGNITINDGKNNKSITPSKLIEFEQNGWTRGRVKTGKFFISNDILMKSIKVTEEEFKHKNSDWYKGRTNYKRK